VEETKKDAVVKEAPTKSKEGGKKSLGGGKEKTGRRGEKKKKKGQGKSSSSENGIRGTRQIPLSKNHVFGGERGTRGGKWCLKMGRGLGEATLHKVWGEFFLKSRGGRT